MRASLVAAILLCGRTVLACSCINVTPEPPDAARRALVASDAVMTGEVVEIAIAPRWWRVGTSAPATDLLSDGSRNARITIEVDKSWKGVTKQRVTIYTPFDCCMCGYNFMVGARYLIYGYWNANVGAYMTNSCTRTSTAERAEADLKQLGAPKYDFESPRMERQVKGLLPPPKQ
jgi:hypothetical protein